MLKKEKMQNKSNIKEEYLLEIAKNSRLTLTKEEIQEILPQLSEILSYFSQIQEIKTETTKPSFHPIEIKNALREDIPKKPLSQEDALKNTNHKKEGYFKGPKVI